MPAILSIPINMTKVANYSSYLPVRIHKDVDVIEKATLETIEFCAPEGSKERMQALYRHSNPFGNVYALCYAEFSIEKLEFFVKILELLWIHDDVTEELPFAVAQNEHNVLRQALDPNQDLNPDTGKTVGVKKDFLRRVRDGMLALDPVVTPDLLHTLDQWFVEFDSHQEDFATFEEYMPFRNSHACSRFSMHYTRWAMDIRLTDEETEAVCEFECALGGIVGLTNDYVSWRKEKLQNTDRIRNAIPLLMQQYSLPQDTAKLLLKGIIIDEEEKAKKLRMKLEEGEMSCGLKRYVEALELYRRTRLLVCYMPEVP